MLGTDWILFVSFILIIAVIMFRDRKNVKREGFMLIRRTKKGRTFIDDVVKRNMRFWKVFYTVGIAVAIPSLVFVSIFLVSNSYGIISGTSEENGVRLLLPGPVSSPVIAPGVFVVPWWIWVIGIFSVMIPHEFSHGIACRLDKIRIKSVGWVLFFIIPGAFVEPDEKQLEKAKKSTRLKMYAAGSFANIVVAFFIIMLFTASFPLLFAPAGVYFQPIEGTPANQTGMTGTLIEIDNQRVITPDDISEILSGHKPGDIIEIKTADETYLVPYMHPSGAGAAEFIAPKAAIVTTFNKINTYTINLTNNPEDVNRAYIGINIADKPVYYSKIDPLLYINIAMVFIWIYIFNLGIGLVNLLPIKPLDGGYVFEILAQQFSKRSATIVKTVSSIMIAMLIFNLIGPILI